MPNTDYRNPLLTDVSVTRYSRNVLEEVMGQNKARIVDLQAANRLLEEKTNTLNHQLTNYYLTVTNTLTPAEHQCLDYVMKANDINDIVYWTAIIQMFQYCKVELEEEYALKLPKRHLVMNTSYHWYHFNYWPYKHRVARTEGMNWENDQHLVDLFKELLNTLLNVFKLNV